VVLQLDELKKFHSFEEVREFVIESAQKRYDQKEAEYPVMAGLYRFDRSTPTQAQLDRDGLAFWASSRFGTEISPADFTSKQRTEIRDLLIEKSYSRQAEARSAIEQLKQKVDELTESGNIPLRGGNGEVSSLADWFQNTTHSELPIETIDKLETSELRQKLESMVEDYFHPEIRRMERMVLLEVVDNAWKDHLLAMDYLRSAVGQRGMAQLDPKVEYKREGMRLFDSLWKSIGERVTDIVFRMEQLSEASVSQTFVETKATHESVPTHSPPAASTEIGRQQQRAIENSQSADRDTKVEPIRNRGEKIGRNDPCHCGSGKKYKACCLRLDAQEV
jgi:preprotein translocase subunit SecA